MKLTTPIKILDYYISLHPTRKTGLVAQPSQRSAFICEPTMEERRLHHNWFTMGSFCRTCLVQDKLPTFCRKQDSLAAQNLQCKKLKGMSTQNMATYQDISRQPQFMINNNKNLYLEPAYSAALYNAEGTKSDSNKLINNSNTKKEICGSFLFFFRSCEHTLRV